MPKRNSKIRQGQNLSWAKDEKFTRGSGSGRTSSVVRPVEKKSAGVSVKSRKENTTMIQQSKKSHDVSSSKRNNVFHKDRVFEERI